MTKMFPIQCGPALPWSMVEPHEKQAGINHGQTLKRLAERHGLSPYEAVCMLESRKLYRNGLPVPNLENVGFYLERLRRHIKKDQTLELETVRARVRTLETQLRNIFSVAMHGGDSDMSKLGSIRNLCRGTGVIHAEEDGA